MTTAITHTNIDTLSGVLRSALAVRQGLVHLGEGVMSLGWFGFANEQNIEPDTNAVLSGGSIS